MNGLTRLFCLLLVCYSISNINCNISHNIKSVQVEAWEKWCGINDGKEVLVVRKELTWEKAQKYCIERNSRLVTMGFSKELESKNKRCLGNIALGTTLWTGLIYKERDTWTWAHFYGNEHISLHQDHPDHRCGAIKLTTIVSQNFRLSLQAHDCSEKRQFICERMQDICNDDSTSQHEGYHKDPKADTYYLPLGFKAEYDNAVIQCNIMSSNLVSIVDEREQSFVQQFVRDHMRSSQEGFDRIWLDGQFYQNKEQGFCWNLYYDFTYHNFLAFEGKCISFVKSNGKWIADLCEKRFDILCQRRCSREPEVGRCFTSYPNLEDILE